MEDSSKDTCCGQVKTDTLLSNFRQGLELMWARVAKVRMFPPAFVEHLDVIAALARAHRGQLAHGAQRAAQAQERQGVPVWWMRPATRW